MSNTIEQKIAEYLKPRDIRWWGHNYPQFAPVLAETQHGDGRKLMSFTSLDTRPFYYLIRVDSNADLDDDPDFVEEIIELLEDEFGTWNEDDENDGEEYPGFPVVCVMTGYGRECEWEEAENDR